MKVKGSSLGDEMNLHMPQDIESESELLNLAAVTWQVISPANNKTIIGIFQESLLGSYRFTRENINFTPRQTMNLLMGFNKVDVTKLGMNLTKNGGFINSFNILSQILPPMSLKYKTKKFDEKDREKFILSLETIYWPYVLISFKESIPIFRWSDK